MTLTHIDHLTRIFGIAVLLFNNHFIENTVLPTSLLSTNTVEPESCKYLQPNWCLTNHFFLVSL
jgi:hypothetical protein